MINEKKNIIDFIEKNKQPVFNIAQAIWEKPELGMQEYNSSKLVAEYLKEHGFTVNMGVSGMPTAFVAEWGAGKPVIGFSSEYDAIPSVSQRNDRNIKVEKIKGAPGHGCGHNLMATAGILAGIALKEQMQKEGLKGTIKVFGTPAEELCIGKAFMARDGLFNNLDALMDWHPYSDNSSGGKGCNAYINMKFHFKGKSSHGNAPWLGRSSLDAAMLMGHAIEMLREHVHPGIKNSSTTINYSFPSIGNEYANVIPDHTDFWCIARAADADVIADILDRVTLCANGSAMATGTTVTREIITATHHGIPNITLSEAVEKNFKEIGVPEYTEEEKQVIYELQKAVNCKITSYKDELSPIVEDYQPVSDSSEYSWFAPCALFSVGITPTIEMGWHNWVITRLTGSSHGMKVLLTASKVLAVTAYDVLTDNELLSKAKEENIMRLEGKTYKSFLENAVPNLNENREAMEKYV